MKRSIAKQVTSVVLASAFLAAVGPALLALPIKAEDSPMEEGIREYSEGHYSEALSRLGGALNSEFNNAKLHYYMGSCYMKLKKKEAAVREFRIAYALEPTGTPGKYAKQALELMNVDKDGGNKNASEVYTKNVRDQKDLSLAIVQYGRDHGSNILGPLFNGSFAPPGFVPSQTVPSATGGTPSKQMPGRHN